MKTFICGFASASFAGAAIFTLQMYNVVPLGLFCFMISIGIAIIVAVTEDS